MGFKGVFILRTCFRDEKYRIGSDLGSSTLIIFNSFMCLCTSLFYLLVDSLFFVDTTEIKIQDFFCQTLTLCMFQTVASLVLIMFHGAGIDGFIKIGTCFIRRDSVTQTSV